MSIRVRNHLKFIVLVLVFLVAYGFEYAGALRWVENAIVERRMASEPREASGDIAFLAIDNHSLKGIGTWPWPREVHAEITRRLFDLGAAEVFFDVDFSLASNEASDAALAEMFEEYGSAILLAAFRQPDGVDSLDDDESSNLPLDRFREHVWLASVNVAADTDGRIRRYPYGEIIEGEEVASAAAMLSGTFGEAGGDFPVNFAITPESVPVYAALDLLRGGIDTAQIEGRSIVIGAHAIELRDNLSVPVHGIISGAMLQILGAETLIAGAIPSRMSVWPLLVAVAVIAIGAAHTWLGRHPAWLLSGFAVLAVTIEAASLELFARDAIIVPTPALHLGLIGVCLAIAARELGLRRWLLRIARIESSNSQAVLERVITDSSDAIIVIDETGTLLEMSDRAHELFEIPPDHAHLTLSSIVPLDLARAAYAAISAVRRGAQQPAEPRDLIFLRSGRPTQIEYTVTPSRLKKVRRRWGKATEVLVACITARDVTLAREQSRRLDQLARFDTLTGAMNRSEFLDHLATSLEDKTQLAVLAVNLHRFKTVNASLGREVGDALLRAFVTRIEDIGMGASHAARLGADTFALFCAGADIKRAEEVAKELIEMTAQPFELANSSARVGARVGIALSTAEGTETAEGLLANAELALDEARREAGDGFHVFQPDSASRQERARQIERALWTAIENEEVYLAYQPQVRLGDLSFVGAEALVRWTHPIMGPISPGEFIEIAEGNGFIEKLGRWVLEQACRDAAEWPDTKTVAVNVSPLQFQRSDVIADVQHALAISGLPPSRLHLEITESIFVAGSSELIETLHDLRMMGIALALDDFGSGFSSFGYLGVLPLDKLKLDQMFIRKLIGNATNAAVVKSVAMLSRDLGLTLVCEGVEDEEVSETLRTLGADQGQGYYYGKPQPQGEILATFDRQSAGETDQRNAPSARSA